MIPSLKKAFIFQTIISGYWFCCTVKPTDIFTKQKIHFRSPGNPSARPTTFMASIYKKLFVLQRWFGFNSAEQYNRISAYVALHKNIFFIYLLEGCCFKFVQTHFLTPNPASSDLTKSDHIKTLYQVKMDSGRYRENKQQHVLQVLAISRETFWKCTGSKVSRQTRPWQGGYREEMYHMCSAYDSPLSVLLHLWQFSRFLDYCSFCHFHTAFSSTNQFYI